jgi:hypothetical protein
MEPTSTPDVNPKTPTPTEEPKFFLASRTILSALLGILPMVLSGFGVEFSDAEAQRLFEALAELLAVAGVIFYRVRAVRPVRLT